MLEVLVCNDAAVVKELCAQAGIADTADILCIRAMDRLACLGFGLFRISGRDITVCALYPMDDLLLADGLLRSMLHVGCERGITSAYYANVSIEPLLEQLHFLENREEKQIKLQHLFSDDCACK